MNTSSSVQKASFFNKFCQPDPTSILNSNEIIADSAAMWKNSEKYNNNFFKISQPNKFDGNDRKKFDFWLL